MITKESLKQFGPYTNMRGIEDNLRIVHKYLKTQRSHKAQELAEKIDYCLYCLQVQFPYCFPEQAPDFLETPLFDEAERKDEEAAARRLAAREARREARRAGK